MDESPTTLARRLAREGNPLIDGTTLTWVWRGRPAPRIAGDWTAWEPRELESAGRGLHFHRRRFPRTAYLEYVFVDPSSGERLRDPHNRSVIDNGMGEEQHTVAMDGWQETTLTRHRRGAARGSVVRTEIDVDGLGVGRTRSVWLYRPAVAQQVPLMVVFDGGQYLKRARLPAIVDNLVSIGRVRPIALAMIQNAGDDRTTEYLCSDATVGLVTEILVPMIRSELDLLPPRRERWAMAGASFGGLQALWTALRAPRMFGRVLSQSGAFGIGPLEPPAWRFLTDTAPATWLDVGRYDIPGLLGANRRMRRRMRDLGVEPGYREYPAGHNWTAWRNSVAGGLEHLFGS